MLLLNQRWFIIKNILLDFKIKNNEEEKKYSNIAGKIINDKINFEIENDKYEYDIKKNIFHKVNTESLLDFKFTLNKKERSTYYIKDLDFYIDTWNKAIEITNNSNYIKVSYELFLEEEKTGIFMFEIIIKEK